MWKFISSILIMSCFLISCYDSKLSEKDIKYPDNIEKENYIIQKDAKKLPNWSIYYESLIRYDKSNGSLFGPCLERYGEGPWSGDGKGIYLDITPDNKHVLLFADTKYNQENTKWSCIVVKNRDFPQPTELLIEIDAIYEVLSEGIYRVYGFRNEELVLKRLYFIYKKWVEK